MSRSPTVPKHLLIPVRQRRLALAVYELARDFPLGALKGEWVARYHPGHSFASAERAWERLKSDLGTSPYTVELVEERSSARESSRTIRVVVPRRTYLQACADLDRWEQLERVRAAWRVWRRPRSAS